MSLTAVEARDNIFHLVHATWIENDDAILGGSRQLQFEGVELRDPPSQNEAWGYVSMLITDTRQSGLCGNESRLYETSGVITVDVYVPRSEISAAEKALSMGHTLRREIEKPQPAYSGIWYRHVTASMARQTGGAVLVRVIADFIYTEQGDYTPVDPPGGS